MTALDIAVYLIMLAIIARTARSVGRFDSHLERVADAIHLLPGQEPIARGLTRKRLCPDAKENREAREKRRRNGA